MKLFFYFTTIKTGNCRNKFINHIFYSNWLFISLLNQTKQFLMSINGGQTLQMGLHVYTFVIWEKPFRDTDLQLTKPKDE